MEGWMVVILGEGRGDNLTSSNVGGASKVKSMFSKGENESMVNNDGSSAKRLLGGESMLDSEHDVGEERKSSLAGDDNIGVSANKFAMLLGSTSRSSPKGSTGAVKNSCWWGAASIMVCYIGLVTCNNIKIALELGR